MEKKVKAIPDGYTSITPYLIVTGADRAIDFYKRAFGAKELLRMGTPDGHVGHAELQVGNARIMLADEAAAQGNSSPQTLGGSPVSILLYVDDCDRVFAQTVDAGAKTVRDLKDQFYGDRMGTVQDPFGMLWHIATHIEDVSADEMERRAKEQHAA